jgi:hypothetical protein
MAAFGAFVVFTVVGLVVVTVASLLSIIVDTILGGRSSKTAAGCAGVEALGIAAAVIGFLVYQVVPIHYVPPC